MPATLANTFLARNEPAMELDAEALATLEQKLVELYERAQAAWPTVDVSVERFASHLGFVAPAGEDLELALSEMNTDDLFLACGCLHGVRGAARAFEQHVLPMAAKAVNRIDPDPTFVEDVCSDVRVKLLVEDGEPPRIRSYLGRGPLVHWVQVTAMRTAQSRKRRKTPHQVDVDMALSVLEAAPEVGHLARELKEPFQAAFKEALGDLTPRERTLLRLYLVEGVSADTIGTMYRVHRATVARWIARARRRVQAATRQRLAAKEVLGPSSFESVMGHVMDGIDVSLASFLQDSTLDGE